MDTENTNGNGYKTHKKLLKVEHYWYRFRTARRTFLTTRSDARRLNLPDLTSPDNPI